MPRLRTPKPRTLAFGVPALLTVGVLGWYVGRWLHLSGYLLWGVRTVLWILGLLIVWLVLKLFPASASSAGKAAPDPVLDLLDQARKRLNAAGVRGRGVLGKLPVLLVLGPRGSAKSTFVQQSGLDAEHLAGNLLSGDMIAPTEAANVWYSEQHVLVEAGGALAVEPTRWARLVQRLQPKKWIPALLGRPQAPRVAIVCFSTEDLLGGAEGVVPAARNLHDRLSELSESIGIRLPVYVVFTKSDAVPHFTEFVKNFTAEETHELLGATLRTLGDPASASSYGQREAERLGGAFDDLFRALAQRRLNVLGRSGSLEGNGAAYEFPREFSKITKPAIQFLVELCRPSQLRVSPFLRGFYFTGVRPVVVEGNAAPAEPSPTSGGESPAGATQVFDLRAMQEQATRQAAPVSGRQRRVPQWVFLDGILRRVVLKDRVAMGITTSGFGLSILRRASLAAGIAFMLFVGIMIMGTHHLEVGLQRDVRDAITGVQDVTGPAIGLASLDDLQRLDTLRQVTERLSHYENGRRPFRSLMFMYTGRNLYPIARGVYFSHFRSVLFNRAFDDVRQTLQDLPAKPTLDEYDRIYQSLKAYVEITERPEEATAQFFGDALTPHWAQNADPDSARTALAQRQFAFFGAELPHGSPYSEVENTGLVNTARSFLADNTNEDSFYGSLLAQWNRLPTARIERDRPETNGFLTGSPAVPGSFTRTGWDSVHASLAATGDAASLDLHVVGTEFFDRLRSRGFEPQTVAPHLQERYERDYRDTWVGFLTNTHLASRALQGGENWLTTLGGNRSPLFQLLAYVDSQTTVNSPTVEAPFAAVRSLVGPDSLPQIFSEASGRPYLLKVQTLAQGVASLAQDPGAPAVSDQVRSASSDGLSFVRGIEVDFPTDPAAARTASAAVSALLASPFRWADQQVGQGPQLAANQLAADFCSRQDSRVLGRYPFHAGAQEASLQDMEALLKPGSGELDGFFQQAEGTGAALNQAYDAFRTRAREVAGAFYRSGGDSPGFSIQFQVRGFDGIDRVELRVDGHSRTFTPTQQERETFVWDASRAETANLVVQSGDRRESLDFNGTWAIFRLFHQGTWQGTGGNTYRVTWTMPSGTTVTADVSVLGAPILDRGYLSTFSCPRRIAR
jgi:type VI secretion system protein ImpL